MSDWRDTPSLVSAMVFAVGWLAGWVGFVRARHLPRASGTSLTSTSTTATRRPVSVIIPCRNEADNLAELLPNLFGVLHADDQVIVVDDDSTDATAAIAQDHPVVVVSGGALPPGWAGKSFACWRGAQQSAHDALVFLDADVRLGPTAMNDIMVVLQQHPEALVSVLPFHRTVTRVERLSMMFNVISSMVASVTTKTEARRVAYGPFMAVYRNTYLRSGGHAHASVRSAVVEDLALARVMPLTVPLLAHESQVEYRMYANGLRQFIEGWTKNTAIGAASVPRWSSMLVIAWVVSLCGGTLISVWLCALSAVQMFVLARRVGNFGVVSAVLYPLHVLTFVLVALRSLVRSALFGSVVWRGRQIATR